MAPVGFEPTISAGERTQTHTLDRLDSSVELMYVLETCSISTWRYQIESAVITNWLLTVVTLSHFTSPVLLTPQ